MYMMQDLRMSKGALIPVRLFAQRLVVSNISMVFPLRVSTAGGGPRRWTLFCGLLPRGDAKRCPEMLQNGDPRFSRDFKFKG